MGRKQEPLYLDVLRELEQRRSKGFDFHCSMELIWKAARERRFLSYKQLADESGVPWSQAHRTIPGHLGELIAYAHHKGWPLLSAVVVNQEGVATGRMAANARAGFVRAARELGISVGADEAGFVDQEQERVFKWAATTP